MQHGVRITSLHPIMTVIMVLQVYREQAASENKPLSDIFDAKLHRARYAL